MLREVSSCCNEDVVHVYEEFSGVFVCKTPEHVVHCMGEGGRGIGEAKEHYAWLEQAKGCFKSSCPLVLFSDANVVVSPANVKLGEDFLPL